jgi:quinoprotein glucose dehydrogenase
VQLAAIRAVTQLKLREASGALLDLVRSAPPTQPAPTEQDAGRGRGRRGGGPRSLAIEALNALEALGTPELTTALEVATASGNERLASAAAAIRARTGRGDALAQIRTTLESGSVEAKQSAIRSLADVKSEAADALLLALLEDLKAGKLAIELAVDVIDTALARDKEPFVATARAIVAGDGSPLAPHRFALTGGDVEAGRKIFFEREDVACVRCHQAATAAAIVGGEVGPKLEGLASRVTRDYILESIVTPNAKIAPGFENVMIEKKNGVWVAGMIKSEGDTELVINSPEDGLVTVKRADVKTRERGMSGMPEGMGQILSRQQLRDLIAYLSTLK